MCVIAHVFFQLNVYSSSICVNNTVQSVILSSRCAGVEGAWGGGDGGGGGGGVGGILLKEIKKKKINSYVH